MFDVIIFNLADVLFSIARYNCVGWEEISIDRNSDVFKPIKAIRGGRTRVRDLDTSATVSLTLLQVSPTNDVLTRIVQEDYISGTGRIDLLLKDQSGNSIFGSSEAYIKGFPKVVYRDSVEAVVWVFECQSTDEYFVGGNSRPNNALLDLVGKLI